MQVGIIGLGAMGQAYARHLSNYGHEIIGTDLPDKKDAILEKLKSQGLKWMDAASQVARQSDILFLLTPLDTIDKVTASIQDSVKPGCIVSPGTSVMTPAVEAAKKYLPQDVHIMPWHWLFGPSVDPKGRNSALVRHRASDSAYNKAMEFFEALELRILEPDSCEKADKISGEVQAKTHIALESIATAWMQAGIYPWENPHYGGGLDNIKAAFALRIFSQQYHVYAGLAIMNPYAIKPIEQYFASVKELYELCILGKRGEYKERIMKAVKGVFGSNGAKSLLDGKNLGEYSLDAQQEQHKPNDHLSICANIDAWHNLGINPFEYKDYFTPPFAFWVGMAQHLFSSGNLLEESFNAPFDHPDLIVQDLDFVLAVSQWYNIIRHNDWKGYQTLFEETRKYFGDKVTKAKDVTDKLIKIV